MAIDAKLSLIQQLKDKLSDSLTVDQMKAAEDAAMSILEGFDVYEITDMSSADDDLLDSYVNALHVMCRSQKTIERYVYMIRKLLEFSKVPSSKISVYHIRNFLAEEKERGIMESTMEGHRQIYSAYFNWLQRESLIEKNPTANLGTIKVAKKEKKIFNESELDRLNRACTTKRQRAIFHFLRATGCRISELMEMNRKDVDADMKVCVVHGKGNKERKVYLDLVAREALKDYLQTRFDNEEPLFITKEYRGEKERVKPNNVRQMLNRLAEKAEVDHVHPHKFRRTLATELARKGMPIQEIAKILGHDKLDTTMKYVIMNDEDVMADYRRYA